MQAFIFQPKHNYGPPHWGGIIWLTDPSLPDKDADKSGSDENADGTQPIKRTKRKRIIRYDKPTHEINPDTTGIDTNADHTKRKEID